MSYDACRDGAITLLRAVQSGGTALFDTEDVGTDYSILDRGSPPYAVVIPGGFGQEGGHSARIIYLWEIIVQLFEENVVGVFNNLSNHRQAIIDKLIQYPTLAGVQNVYELKLGAPSRLEPVFRITTGEPEMYMQEIVLTVTEKVTVEALQQ